MIVRDHPALSLSRQCRLLALGRSSLYYTPKGESAGTLAPMRRIDELFLKYPFYGARRMALHLRREGVRIGRRRAARLMRPMGLQAIYRAPRTSDPHPEHRVWPYLLRGLAIERPNHVRCADITYIPVRAGSSWPRLPLPCGGHGPALERRASGSRWMAGAGAWTTSSSSGCGVRSNTRRSIWRDRRRTRAFTTFCTVDMMDNALPTRRGPEKQPEYTLNQPPGCPKRRGHLSLRNGDLGAQHCSGPRSELLGLRWGWSARCW